MNDNRVTRQTYKTLLGSTVDASIRNALGDIGNRIGLTTTQFANLKKDNLLVKPTLHATTAFKHDDQLAALKNVKISKTTTTTTTTSMTITNKQFVSTNNDLQSLSGKKDNSNNSCMMVEEEEEEESAPIKEPSEDVELEEEEEAETEDDDDDEWVDDDEDEEVDEVLDEERSSLEDVIDIDQLDGENPQLVAEYVKDIYKYLNQMEKRFRISPTFLENKIVTSKMRSVLIDWLIQVHLKFHLLQETLYLCVQIIDAYLQAQDVSKMQLQLVGVTAMFLASKYEEMYVPAIDDFVYMTDNTYTKSEIRQMEISILKTLNFMFGKPLPLHFLRRFSKAACADPKQHTLAKYFMELSLHDAEFSSLDPSYLAACSLCLSFKLLDGPEWNKTIEHYSTYKQSNLWSGMQKIAKLCLKSMDIEYKYRAATNKYGASKCMRISLIPELSSKFMRDLANGQLPMN